jgi:hypothetical protein
VGERPDLAAAVARMSVLRPAAALFGTGKLSDAAVGGRAIFEAAAQVRLGLGSAFIGGGCCVHLSVEYTPSGASDGLVAVLVEDSEDTTMAWVKRTQAGLGYQIKEGIVTTKPGAHLVVLVASATARVRWCEVFSCC